jgi:hypothetical protein
LGGGPIPFQIDIGFGDAVTPVAREAEVPTFLPGPPYPRLRAYPCEIVVAEKPEVMLDVGITNGRLKDDYDIPFDEPLRGGTWRAAVSFRR